MLHARGSLHRVTVLTAQSSKGLEFQSVVLVGIGRLSDAEEDLSDCTRLLYVAMTRARRDLVLTGSAENAFTTRLLELTA